VVERCFLVGIQGIDVPPAVDQRRQQGGVIRPGGFVENRIAGDIVSRKWWFLGSDGLRV